MYKMHLNNRQMKKVLVISLAVVCFALSLSAQDSQTPIDKYYLPTYNSDFIYFFLRKNSRLSEGLVGVEVDYQEDNTTTKSKLFIPLLNKEKWNYVIPVYFDRYQFKSSNEDGGQAFEMRNFFFQSVLNYYPNKKWTFTSIIEGRIRGNEDSHFEERGNMIAHYFVTKYNFSEKFSVLPAFLVGHQWNDENETVVFPSLEFKWNPNQDLAFIAGVPGFFGLEWSASKNYDLVLHSMLDNGILTVNAALRKRFSDRIDLTFRFNRDGYGNTFVPTSTLTKKDQLFSYNQVNQMKHAVSAELTFRPTSSLMFQVEGGYNLNSTLQVIGYDDKTINIEGKAGAFVGVGAYWRFKKQ